MFHKRFLSALLVLGLAIMACSIQLPITEVKTGPVQTEPINISTPDASVVDLTLAFGAGNLKVASGAGNQLLTGTATYNVQDFKPKTSVQGNQVRMDTGNIEIKGFPKISNDIKNDWDLKLGDQQINLKINAGAYKGNYDLGGLSLTGVDISDGAADTSLRFTQPNLIIMNEFRYVTGASSVRLAGLANANFKTMTFRSGAGNYSLDFSGKLAQDAEVTVESGISQVTIIIPESVSAQLIFKGGLSNVTTHGAWEKSGKDYINPGSGLKLTITVTMGAGSLDLRNVP